MTLCIEAKTPIRWQVDNFKRCISNCMHLDDFDNFHSRNKF